MLRRGAIVLMLISGILAFPEHAWGQDPGNLSENEATSDIFRIAIILTLLAVLPAIFISMTSFIRIVIVLAMVRHAFGMPETPPNPILISLALFLAIFTMMPTLQTLNDTALQPFLNGELASEEAIDRASAPMRDFMLAQVNDEDLQTIYAITGTPLPETPEDVNLLNLTPAFILNELRISFTIGFIILLPFLLIDLVVSSVLLSLGMMMVPPSTISLPIKLLMFVVIDGWSLVIQGVVGGFG